MEPERLEEVWLAALDEEEDQQRPAVEGQDQVVGRPVGNAGTMGTDPVGTVLVELEESEPPVLVMGFH